MGGALEGCRAGVLGVAFKPGTDDVRDSASLDVCCRLAAEGAHVTVHDPVATGSAARLRQICAAASALEAANGADVLLHLANGGIPPDRPRYALTAWSPGVT